MTKLRERMFEDMHLHGLSKNTQESYLMSVRILARYYWRPPDQNLKKRYSPLSDL